MKKVLKSIYTALPLKKEVFWLIKKVVNPKESVFKHLHFVGNFKVQVNSDIFFKIRHHGFQIENEVFWQGIFNGWEKYSMKLWYDLSKNANVIFDIGANTGVYSLLAKTTNNNAVVFAFEPVSRVYDKLCFNNKINNYDIKCFEKAISNNDGVATIFDKDTAHTYSVTVNEDRSSDKSNSIPVEITTIRLDTFINTNNIPKIDLMKIDVEMHEVEALEGFGKYLNEFKPTILIEILSEDIAKGINELVSDIGYYYFNIDENKGVKKVSKLTKSDGMNFLICMPEIANKIDLLKGLV